jgi:hypothetical protein
MVKRLKFLSIQSREEYRLGYETVALWVAARTQFRPYRSEHLGSHRLRVFENRVLRSFGPEREQVAGGWR